jgi:hypothetical protein
MNCGRIFHLLLMLGDGRLSAAMNLALGKMMPKTGKGFSMRQTSQGNGSSFFILAFAAFHLRV